MERRVGEGLGKGCGGGGDGQGLGMGLGMALGRGWGRIGRGLGFLCFKNPVLKNVNFPQTPYSPTKI